MKRKKSWSRVLSWALAMMIIVGSAPMDYMWASETEAVEAYADEGAVQDDGGAEDSNDQQDAEAAPVSQDEEQDNNAEPAAEPQEEAPAEPENQGNSDAGEEAEADVPPVASSEPAAEAQPSQPAPSADPVTSEAAGTADAGTQVPAEQPSDQGTAVPGAPEESNPAAPSEENGGSAAGTEAPTDTAAPTVPVETTAPTESPAEPEGTSTPATETEEKPTVTGTDETSTDETSTEETSVEETTAEETTTEETTTEETTTEETTTEETEEVSVSISGKVSYNKKLEVGQFTFRIKEVDEQGNRVDDGFSAAAKNDADGSFTFDEIIYNEAGTHYYKVSQRNGGKTLEDITYDGSVYTVTVEVSENEDGLSAEADKDASVIRFQNEYVEPVKTVKTVKTEFSYEDNRVKIKATAYEGANLPEDAQLRAEYMAPGSSEYEEAVAAIESQLGDSFGANDEDVKMDYVLYDVYFTSESKGVRIDPEDGEVSVEMTFLEPVKAERNTEVVRDEVVHVKESGQAEIVTDYVNTDSDGAVTSVGFTQDSFSPVGLVRATRGVEENNGGEIDLLEIAASPINVTAASDVSNLERGGSFDIAIKYTIPANNLVDAKNNPTWVYDLTEFVQNNPVKDLTEGATGQILQGTSERGTYVVHGNKVYLKINESWLGDVTSAMEGTFSLTVATDKEKIGTDKTAEFEFPGTGTKIPVTFKDVTVNSSKKVQGVETNNNSNVYLTRDEDGKYRLNYELWVKPDTNLTELVLTDTLSGKQKLEEGSFVVKESNGIDFSNNIPGDAFNITENGFTLDLAKIAEANRTQIKGGTDYTIKYSTVIEEKDLGNIEANHAEWAWNGGDGDKTITDTSVTTKKKLSISKTVSPGQDASGNQIYEYTIVIGDGYENLAGHIIRDEMSNNQKLVGDISITPAVPTGAGGESNTLVSSLNDQTSFSDATITVFQYTFPETGEYKGPYTITYKTTLEGVSGLYGDHSINNRVTDTHGDDTGEGYTDKRYNFGEEEKKAELDKKFEAWDEENREISWNIDVKIKDGASIPLKDVVVTEGEYKYGGEYYQGNSLVLLWDKITVKDSEGKGVDYTIDDTKNEIRFSELSKDITIHIVTRCPEELTDSLYFKNRAELSVDGKMQNADEETKRYHNNDYSMTKEGSYDPKTKVFNWKVVINPGRNIIEPGHVVYFEDQLPEGMEFIGYYGNPKVIHVGYGGGYWQGGNKEVTIVDNKIQRVNVSELTDGQNTWGPEHGCTDPLSGITYIIEYQTRLSDSEFEQVGSGTEEYTNIAYEVTEDGAVLKSADATAEYKYLGVTKEEKGFNNDIIEYEVIANPDGLDLDPEGDTLTLTDRIAENVELVTNSVKVYNKDGALMGGVRTGYSNETRTLTITIPDKEYVRISFKVVAQELGYQTFSNSIVLKGKTDYYASEERQHDIIKHSATIDGENDEIYIHKVDGNNLSKDLVGAQFVLGAATIADDGSIAEETVVGSNYFSNESGTVTFGKLESEKLYYWKEIKAPVGYAVANTDKHYFIMYQVEIKNNTEDVAATAQNKQAAQKLAQKIESANEGIKVYVVKSKYTWTVTNSKTATAIAKIVGTKTLNGRDMEENEFEFTITAGSNTAEGNIATPMPEETKVRNIAAVNGVASAFEFGDITYTVPGEYTYQVKETGGKLEGIKYDDKEYTVIVTVERDEADGSLSATVTYSNKEDSVDSISFENTYTSTSTSIKKQISGTKKLTGKKLEDKQFSFEMRLISVDGFDAAEKKVYSATNDADGNINFPEITYDKKGKYIYEVRETSKSGNGITVDDSIYKVTIDVTEDSKGNLLAKDSIIKDGKAADLVFVNKYETGNLTVSKTVAGNAADTNKDFEFTVTLSAKTVNGTHGDMLFENGVATFTLKHNESKKAENLPTGITYTVEETDYTADGYKKTMTGNTGTISKGEEKRAEFTNTRDVGSLKVSKVLDGNDTDSTKKFTFKIKLGSQINGTYSGVEFITGEAKIQLKGGEEKTIEGLPVGTTYKVTEAEANQDGYTTTWSGNEGTINKGTTAEAVFTNTRNSVGSLKVSKTVAGNAADTNKDFEFTVTLSDKTVNGTYGDMLFENGVATFTLKHNESKKAENLPTGITYTVEETDYTADGYTTTWSGNEGTINKGTTAEAIFTNTRNSVGSLKVSKTVSGNGADTDKQFEFTVTLGDKTITGKRGQMTFTDGVAIFWLRHGETMSAEDLPNGVSYEVQEKDYSFEGYRTESTGNIGVIIGGNEVTATFTNTFESIEISGKKIWNDNNNKAGKRPSSVTVILLADGKQVQSKQVTDETTDASGNWLWEFKELPKYKSNKEIVYTVSEEPVTDYSTEINGNNITNTYTSGMTSRTVRKIWKGDADQTGKRPASISVQLYADGKPYNTAVVVLNEDNNWSHTWTDLPEKQNQQTVVYTVKEIGVPKGYIKEISVSGTEFVITNTYVEDTTYVTGTKIWNDKADQDGKRPKEITVNVKDGDDIVDTIMLSAGADGVWQAPEWIFTSKALPKYRDGQEIEYTVEEVGIEGYTPEYREGNSGIIITNTYVPETTKVSGSKIWDDEDDKNKYRPSEITVYVKDGEKTVDTIVLSAGSDKVWQDNELKFTSKDLPKYRDGKEIVYTVKEEKVENYTASYSGTVITNTFKPEEAETSETESTTDTTETTTETDTTETDTTETDTTETDTTETETTETETTETETTETETTETETTETETTETETPGTTPDTTPGTTPDTTPGTTPESTPGTTPESTTETETTETETTETASETVPSNVPGNPGDSDGPNDSDQPITPGGVMGAIRGRMGQVLGAMRGVLGARVRTGDESIVFAFMYVVLMIVAIGAITVVVMKRRKKKNMK